jgi:hypothetical protein
MGRPIKKKFFGAEDASVTSSNENDIETVDKGSFGITVTAYIPASGEAGYISGTGGSSAVSSTINRQVGSNKYVVTNAQGVGRIVLVKENPTKGQGVLLGYIAETGDTENESTSGGTSVAIAKLTARLAVDFDGNRYKWTAQNDSTEDYIELTAI